MRPILALLLAFAIHATEPVVIAADLLPGPDGEADAILERIKLYRERHGSNGALNGEQMLERTRWGYERWLAAEHRRMVGDVAGDGWVSLGPANSAGRMTAIAPHPVLEGTVLAGAASGGVWKTSDHGESWRPLTDGLSDLSVGAVAYAPSNPDVVYLGTGEAGLGSFFVPGIGVLRSSDGGETWFLPQPGDIVAEQFFALSVDPRDEDRVLAATERGLALSVDGGVTWDFRIAHPELKGATEVLRSATDPDRMWAALWCFSECPAGLGRVMASTDGGSTWMPSVGNLPDAIYNSPNLNRIALALAPSDDRVRYVALNNAHYTPMGPDVVVYRTSDDGITWNPTSDPGPYLVSQGWYDNAITIHPTDPDTVVAAGVWYVRTTDGGATWTTMDPISAGDWMGTDTLPHVDGHAFSWQDDTLWLGCDGGVWTSADNGATWTGRNEGLVTRQYYGLDIDPIRTDRMLGGTQDNKTNLRYGPDDDDWEWVLDGDGFDTAINPLLPELVYGTIYGTLVFRSFDGGVHWHKISPATGGDLRPFLTPLTMRNDQPWVLFTGSSRVWQTTDAGDSWTALGMDVVNGEWSQAVVRSVAVTPVDHDLLIIAKGAGIFSSTDGGQQWTETPAVTFVNSVTLSPNDPELAVAGLARTPNGEAPLLRSTDGGLNWYPSAAGLPPFSVPVVAWHPRDPAVVFAGTDVGLYRSDDFGVTWSIVGDGLPAVSVHAIAIAEDGSRVVVGTHGRGIWELPLLELPGAAPSVTLDGPAEAHLGESVVYSATAVDPDDDTLDLRFLSSDAWAINPGGTGIGSVTSWFQQIFRTGGEFLVAANAIDATGRTGFDSIVVTAFEPGDDCRTPRIIPGDGPFPVTILTDNSMTTVGDDDPEVPCTIWPGHPDVGRYGSIWLEFTPAVSGRYTVSTCGSTPDTALSAWTGPRCGPYTAVADACSDDDRLQNCLGRDTDSWLGLELVAGETTRVLVGATDDDELGDIRITIDCVTCENPLEGAHLVVPAAASAPGAEDSFWTTNLQLVNPGDDSTTATIELLPGPDTTSASTVVELDSGAALVLDDVVDALTGDHGTGALRLSATAPVAAVSRTATRATPGSYGQGIPADDETAAVSDGAAVRLLGFARDTDFRTNLGLVNPGDDGVSLVIRFYDDETTRLAETERNLEPGTWLQLNRIFEDHDIVTETDLVVIRQTSRNGRFLAYASVVDERTGDPTYLSQPEIGRVGDALWIPAAASTDGVGGTRWRTDLSLANPGTGDLLTNVELIGADGVIASATIHILDGWVRNFPDVVSGLLGSEGTGAIRLSPSLGLVMATNRTYAADPDGSYGQGIPGIAESRAFTTGERAILPGLRQDSRFRTNIGFVNAGSDPVDLVLTAHDIDGATLDTLSVQLEAPSWIQLNQALPKGSAYAIVSTETPNAAFLAYASVVDRPTDDPTYIAAVRAED